MASRQTKGREGRCTRARILLVLVLLPVLVCGPALGGMAALLHSHGPAGGHLHLLATQPEHGDLASLHDRHDDLHRHDQDAGTDEDEQPTPPAPEGLLLELPQMLAVAPGGRTAASMPSLHVPVLVRLPRWHLVLAKGTHRLDRCHSGWPPQSRELTGVAALLRSSHAILI